uniref:13S globulin n=1 Tax=Fagopyrum esculentum TaxID=3617 RepID=Q84MJ4_FAGES|nr:13S globulin [Fagopyrum esculentum]AAQ56206.1 13S globulin [Fagopyrum esculentum]
MLHGVLLCIMVSLAASETRTRGSSTMRARQCRLDQLTSSQPNQKIRSEGGTIEVWDEEEDQFQCAGVAAMRVTVQPDSLSLPSYYSSPRLVYVEQGEGVFGLSLPGCPETYQSRGMEMRGDEEEEEGFESGRRMTDAHQPTRRVRKGDVVALPQGTVHWCFNDGQEDLVVVAVHNLNTDANQLDQSLKTFFLAGGVQGGSKEGKSQKLNSNNILSAFETKLLAEALGTEEETVRKMQESDERGPIVKARKNMRQMVTPPRFGREQDEDETNGLEESFCNMRFRHNLGPRTEADIASRQAGRIHSVDQNKLPILEFIDMSAEKGHLLPNAMLAPAWPLSGHRVFYVLRGEAQRQIVDDNGQTVLDDRVSEGSMVVIPQFYISTCRAGRDGLEYVSFETTANPMSSPLNGHASVFKGMPIPVLSNSYQISPRAAYELKQTRSHEHGLFSPFGGRS